MVLAGPSAAGHRLAGALAVTLVFAVVARVIRGVTTSGALAGALVSFLLYAAAGPGAFLVLVSVFVLTWITTRLGYPRKERRGTAEKRGGRTASQVLANLGVAAISAGLYGLWPRPVFLLMVSAALAEAAGDTVSSELGQLTRDTAVLITTWEDVPSGTDGGITVGGTLAGAFAAALISLVCALMELVPAAWFWISAAAAVVGMLADSVLGASLQRKGILNNDGVNFLSTAVAAVTAVVMATFWH